MLSDLKVLGGAATAKLGYSNLSTDHSPLKIQTLKNISEFHTNFSHLYSALNSWNHLYRLENQPEVPKIGYHCHMNELDSISLFTEDIIGLFPSIN